ncbi:hypothetical protein MMPV_006591 [Pyropia vietnamensis]
MATTSISTPDALASESSAASAGGIPPPAHPGRALFVNAVEVPTPVALRMVGTLPSWLTGTLLRIGPGTFVIPRGDGGGTSKPLSFSHWFDGLGILHRFHLPGDGTIMYSARKTAAEEEARLAGGATLGGTFGQDPCAGVFARVRAAWAGLNHDRTNVNVSVGRFGKSGDVYARTDANVLLQVDPSNLDVTGRTSYAAHNKALRGPLSSAHPETCPETGDTYNFTMDFGAAGATYTIFCVPAAGGLSAAYEVARINAPPRYIHSFFLTSRYIILGAWPTLIRPLRLLWEGNFASAVDFEADSATLFYVIDRHRPGAGGGSGSGGDAAAAAAASVVATYTAPPLFCFHTVNAYETPSGDLSLTLCHYPDTAIIQDLGLGKLASAPSRDFHRPRLATYTLPNPAGVAAATVAGGGGDGRRRTRPAPVPAEGPVFLSGQQIELPRINPAFATRRHSHTYGTSYVEADKVRGDFYWNALAKVTTPMTAEGTEAAASTAVLEWSETGCYPSEPVFVARPGGSAEDDGVVLSVVVDVPRCCTFLLVLDAKTFKELARAEVDEVVPLTFHGSFLGLEGAAPA